MEPEELPLPEPWVTVDGDDGLFYHNEETGESQWEHPLLAGDNRSQSEKRDPTPVDDSELPHPWIAVDGDDGVFYHNEETGESQWEPPLAEERHTLSPEHQDSSNGGEKLGIDASFTNRPRETRPKTPAKTPEKTSHSRRKSRSRCSGRRGTSDRRAHSHDKHRQPASERHRSRDQRHPPGRKETSDKHSSDKRKDDRHHQHSSDKHSRDRHDQSSTDKQRSDNQQSSDDQRKHGIDASFRARHDGNLSQHMLEKKPT